MRPQTIRVGPPRLCARTFLQAFGLSVGIFRTRRAPPLARPASIRIVSMQFRDTIDSGCPSKPLVKDQIQNLVQILAVPLAEIAAGSGRTADAIAGPVT